MMKLTMTGMAGLAFAAMLSGASAQTASGDIKIGEVNSYSGLPAFTEPYRKGWQLALEEINAAGGVNGRQIKISLQDDVCDPKQAVSVANRIAAAGI